MEGPINDQSPNPPPERIKFDRHQQEEGTTPHGVTEMETQSESRSGARGLGLHTATHRRVGFFGEGDYHWAE